MGFKKASGESKLLVQQNGVWILGGGRHVGKPLSQVAIENPKYLLWLYDDYKIQIRFSDEAFYALQETMELYGILNSKQ